MQKRNRSATFTTAAGIFAGIFVLVFGTILIVTLLLPQRFRSTARIKVDASGSNPQTQSVTSSNAFASSPQTEVEVIGSSLILNEVVADMNLNEVWGKKYYNNQRLKTSESCAFLKRQIDVRNIVNTSIIEIRVYSDDKKEAADIANATVEAYTRYRKGTDTSKSSLPLVTILDRAEPSGKAVQPNVPLNLVLGGMLGAIAGAVVSGLFLLLVLRKPRPVTTPPIRHNVPSA